MRATFAPLPPKDLPLIEGRIHVGILDGPTGRQPMVEWAPVRESSVFHLPTDALVAAVEGRKLAPPSQGLWMPRVSVPSAREDGPNRVDLPMLAEEVAPAEFVGWEVPDAQRPHSVSHCCAKGVSRYSARFVFPTRSPGNAVMSCLACSARTRFTPGVLSTSVPG